MPLIGVSPGPIEHIFSVGVALQIGRASCDKGLTQPHADELGRPTGFRNRTAGVMQSLQIFQLHERGRLILCCQQRIPLSAGEFSRVRVDADDIIGGAFIHL